MEIKEAKTLVFGCFSQFSLSDNIFLKFFISCNSDFRGTSLSPRSVRKENVYELKFFISFNSDFRETSLSPKTSNVFIRRTTNGMYICHF